MIKKHKWFFYLISFFLLYSCTGNQKEKINELLPDSLTIEEITEKIRNNPGNAVLFGKRATLYLNNNHREEALRDMEIAIKLDSLNYEYYITIAELYILQGNSEKAKEKLEKYQRLSPGNARILIALAKIYLYVDQFKQSMNYLNMAAEQDRNIPEIYFIKALIFKMTKDTVSAIEFLQIAVDKNQDYYEAYNMLGYMYAQKKDSLAVTYYQKAIRLVPQSIESHYNMAMYYQENGHPEKALAIYDTLIHKVDSAYPYAYYNIGYIYMEHQKKYRESIPWFSKAISFKKDYVDAYYNRGVCYEKLKEYDKAKNEYRITLEMQSNYPLGIEGLNRIDQYYKK